MESIERGDIVLVNFDPSIGEEIKKRRPAVVVSNNMNNRHAPLVTVVPITSNISRVYRWEVYLPKTLGLQNDSKAIAAQIRTVSKKRLLRKLTELPADVMKDIDKAILLHLGLQLAV